MEKIRTANNVIVALQFVVLLATAAVTYKRVGVRLGRLTKSLILFNLLVCLFDTLFSLVIDISYLRDVHVWQRIAFCLDLAIYQLQNINWAYLLRLKRVQVQLRTEREETNAIITDISRSERAQNIYIMFIMLIVPTIFTVEFTVPDKAELKIPIKLIPVLIQWCLCFYFCVMSLQFEMFFAQSKKQMSYPNWSVNIFLTLTTIIPTVDYIVSICDILMGRPDQLKAYV